MALRTVCRAQKAIITFSFNPFNIAAAYIMYSMYSLIHTLSYVEMSSY